MEALLFSLIFSKLYHSIHAKGERVEDVIEAFKTSQAEGTEKSAGSTQPHDDAMPLTLDDDIEDGEWEGDANEDQLLEEGDQSAGQVYIETRVSEMLDC